MINQGFTVIPSGLINGGFAFLSIDTDTGSIAYSAQVDYGIWPIKKTFSVPLSSYLVPPEDLKTSFVKAVGQTIFFGPVALDVVSLTPSVAIVGISVLDKNISGTANLDLTGEFLKLVSASVQVSAYGLNLNIQLQKEDK